MVSAESTQGAAGVDAGATLTKLALPGADGAVRLERLPSDRVDEVLLALRDSAPVRVGVTGGGAARLCEALPMAVAVSEFAAWRAGVRQLLGEAGTPQERFLLVSIGTGTSILLVDGENVQRLGGTPLGGGTVIGLGARLAGSASFEALCRKAEQGDRSRVDLSVAEVYPEGGAPLATDVMAASFARLAGGAHGAEARPEDCARSIMAMVGENVALLAGSLSLLVGAERLVFGGSTLEGNATLRAALVDYVARFGREALFLERGAFAGALGARCLSASG